MSLKIKDLTGAIAAGVVIAIACLVNLNIQTNWVGALLFSVGLVLVCVRKYSLFTGKVGYASSFNDVIHILVVLIGNIVGVAVVTLLSSHNTDILVASKLEIPLHLVFFKGIGCGYLMYVAVDTYKKENSLIGVFLCVPAFILAGFEHSIADACYFLLSSTFTTEMLTFLVIVIFGNAMGAQITRLMDW